MPCRVWFSTSAKNCAELPAKIPGVTAPDSTSISTESLSDGDQLEKSFAARRPRVTIERGQSGRVRLAGRCERSAERAIDVMRGARLPRARSERVAGIRRSTIASRRSASVAVRFSKASRAAGAGACAAGTGSAAIAGARRGQQRDRTGRRGSASEADTSQEIAS